MGRQRKTFGEIPNRMFTQIKRSAKRRGIEFDLDKDYIWELLIKQEFTCALSGQQIKFVKKLKNGDLDFERITGSLDRIDSSKGYIRGNVQWVHKMINQMKWHFQEEEFIGMCELVAKKRGSGKTQPSPVKK